MRELKMVIVPSETETRVWGRDATRRVKVHATLPPKPSHPLAVPWLLEALGCFIPVRAALVVTGPRCTYASKLYPDWFGDFGGPHYELSVRADHDRRPARP
jgi:hypothetical protein